ncbi:putative mediator of RNA polymerase II transcription subunit 26b [Dichanthelium oligosanthes]|uniref:Putative mediator of RNA polymerase II transcription subunit 26b n=1 Tax=Dichanthelium oligosanthes TaxID=888268 RepID=A0A1E5W8D1_9POAL|nr:putative mediator of RNA polymerase II transcription subunit 26b [Dichanthelium oligosanthes]
MAPPPSSLDYWRGFFSGARASIFDAIDAAIRVAAVDHPDGLRARRDAIAERLYTALIALQPPEGPGLPAQGQPALLLPEGAGSVPSLCSSDRAEVVTDGGAAPLSNSDDAVLAEAFRVKAALSNAQEKSEAELLELLERLRRLEFTVDTIMATEIGMAVQPLRKHGSKQIRQLVRSLIEGWKATVNEWVNNGGPIVDQTPQSVDASCLDQEEGGLPSPPMDEAALFATPCTSIQLSEFFDEMDDDGNIRSDAKEHRQCNLPNQESVKKQSPMGQWYDPEQNWKLDKSAMKQSRQNEPFNWQRRQQSNPVVQGKPSNAAFGPGRPQMMHLELKGSEMISKLEQDVSVVQRRPKPTMPKPSPQQDENSVRAKLELAKEAKLEATKRKLQEGYQEFINAKKQRTVQMVDPQDLPKQGNRNLALNKARNNNHIRNRLGIRR